jgi:predicted DNA-binding transcriptional regulator AlpA
MTDEAEPPFMRRDEVEKIHPVTDRARRAAENVRLFPPRVQLSPHVAAWRRSEVLEWLKDPAGWAARQRTTAA